MTTPSATTPSEADIWDDGMVAIFAELCGLKTWWRDRARPAAVGLAGFCTLFIASDRVLSTETRLDVNDLATTGKEIEPSVNELHLFELLVQVETATQLATKSARFLAQQIRTRLERDETLLALEALSTSVVDVGPVLSASLPVDGRQRAVATIVVRMHRATSERAPALGYIQTVQTQPSIEGEDGLPMPLPAWEIVLP